MSSKHVLMEKLAIKFIISGFLVLFAYQIVIADSTIRQNIIMVDRLEGREIDEKYNEENNSYITIHLKDSDTNQDIRVLINGRYVKNVVNKDTIVYVKNNDIIEIDTRNTIKPITVNMSYKNCYDVFGFKTPIVLKENIKILARIKI